MSDKSRARGHFARDDSAVSSIEYALVASLIAVVCVAIVATVGTNLSALYQDICNQVSTAVNGTTC
jgi:pilus assembly protein Flp/PilA